MNPTTNGPDAEPRRISRPRPGPVASTTLGDRFRRLHAEQRRITSDLSLTAMLPRVVRAACEVIDVRVAVLGVRSGDAYDMCLQEGFTADTVAVGLTGARTLPEILSTLRDQAGIDEQAVRHVEIRIRDSASADLVVALPRSGRFGADDLEMLSATGRSVGSALSHATLVEQARRSSEWLHASGEIARALLAEADIDTFGEVVARAVAAADADYGHLILPTPDGRLRATGAHGIAGRHFLDQTWDATTSEFARSVIAGRALRHPAVVEMLSDRFVNTPGLGPVMTVPLLDALGTRGSVVVARREGRPPFTAVDLTQFSNYGAQVALAMQFADARSDTEHLAAIEHRTAASRQVGDVVMQRLFATGLGLASLLPQLTDSGQAEQLQRHIRDLDITIEELRNALFDGTDTAGGRERRPAMFPRITTDPTPAADATTAPVHGNPPPRRPGRGRRRTDWTDGTGGHKE